MNRKTAAKLGLAISGVLLVVVVALAIDRGVATREPPGAGVPHIELSKRLSNVKIEQGEDGPRVVVGRGDREQAVTPDEFVAMLQARQRGLSERGILFRIFDITTWAGLLWVAVGLGGQVLFTGRMLVQWLVSEKRGESTVPVAFWWMSLTGATMLLIYFTWRIDIVGVLGQCTGWFIYGRNLMMIYRGRGKAAEAAEDAAVASAGS